MIAQHRPRATTTAYGSPTFAAHLAAREAALGLAGIAQTTQELHKSIPQPDGVTPADAASPDASATWDMGVRRDAWDNVIVSGPRLNGAYVMRHWYGNRVVYVCGAPEQHVKQEMWRRDGRVEGNGQGFICCACHVYEAGLYGIFERERQ